MAFFLSPDPMPLLSTNPATGKPIREHTPLAEADAHAALRETAEAQRHWRLTPPTQRTALCNTLQNHLRQRREALAHLITEEMGKPITESREEVEQCAELCGWLAANLAEALRPEIRDADGTRHCIHYIPAGVVLGVLPWNYPLWQVFRAAAPAIAAGNGFALKHASTVQQTAAAAEALFAQAGFPPSLLRNLPVTSALVPSLIAHPAVTAVTVTGSTAAGKVIAAEAAGRIKKTVLELGGSDAYIILEDADLDRAAETCAAARLVNCGQSCIAAKRFIVVEAVAACMRRPMAPGRPPPPARETTGGNPP
ncbi:MAG: aldehyde dehydrogenase family protein, partial [Puniceicoccaceae bacterium]